MKRRAPRPTSPLDLGPAWLLGAAAFVFLDVGGEFENYPKMLFLQWGIAALVAMRFLASREPAQLPRRSSALDWAVLSFLVGSGLSLLWAASPLRAAVPMLQIVAGVALYWLLSRSPRPTRTARSIFVSAAVSSGLVSALGLLQYGFAVQWVPQAQPPAATFSNRNMAAQFVVICLPLAFAALIEARRRPAKVWASLSILCSLGYLVVARTRAAWLALFVVLLLILSAVAFSSSLRARRPSLRIAAAALLLIATLVGAFFLGHLAELDERGPTGSAAWVKAGSGTVGLRLIYWKNTLAMGADRFPLGVGLGNFTVAYPRYHRAAAIDWTFGEEFQLRRAHNDHLQLFAELGLFGFAAYVAMLLLFFRTWRRAVRDVEPSTVRRVGLVGLSVVAFLVVATFSFPMERALPPIYLFACIGLVSSFAAGRAADRPARIPTGQSPWARAVLAAALVAYVAVSGYVMRRAILADAEQARALESFAAGERGKAAAHLRRAREMALGDPAATLLIARELAAEGRYDQTASELERALKLHPNQINAMLNLGYSRLQLGRYEEAEHSLRQALEILPGSLTAHSNLGLIRFRSQDYDEAIRNYRRVLELAADKRHYGDRRRTEEQILVAHLQLGASHAALGKTEEAVRHYELALEAKPDLEQVGEILSRLYELLPERSPPIE